jgi:hypothetical protein
MGPELIDLQEEGGVSARSTGRAVCPHELQEDRRWQQSQSVVLQETRWSLVLRQEEQAHRRRPVVLYYRSGFLNPTTAHEEVRSEGHNVRWWESG